MESTAKGLKGSYEVQQGRGGSHSSVGTAGMGHGEGAVSHAA